MKFKTVLGTWLLGIFALSGTAIAKESGEKGGTADINIGVGELQEDKEDVKKRAKAAEKKATKKRMKKTAKKKKRAAKESVKKDDSKPRKKKTKGKVETEWKVEEGEK